MSADYIVPLDSLSMADVPRVGGKNASLGEMIRNLAGAGVRVPGGFATTAQAFWAFLDHNDLRARIQARLAPLDVADVVALAAAGAEIRRWVEAGELPPALEDGLREAYAAMGDDVSVAVRSSATAEDLPDASFAGQQETYLHVRGIDALPIHVKKVFASLYNDRAIAYRVHHGFAHADVALSAGVQRMVRSDLACAGVLFTLDTESGFRDVVFITAAYGLGETVVQGAVNPDEFYVHKPRLADGFPAVVRRELGGKATRMVWRDGATVIEDTPADMRRQFALADAEVLELARQAVAIEAHYGRPMDVEWAKDGESGELFIVQARPETVKARSVGELERYVLKATGEVRVAGRAIGQKIGAGPVRLIASPAEMERVRPGDAVVAMASSGFHSNGFSLVRKILAVTEAPLDEPLDGRTLGEALLEPTRIYVKPVLALLDKMPLKGIAHITGGGLVENVPRVLPANTAVRLEKARWPRPAVFDWLQTQGNVPEAEMHRTFNCGIGMAVIVAREHADRAMQLLRDAGETVWQIGSVEARAEGQPQTVVQ